MADCATHTSVSNPVITAVERPVARIASTAAPHPHRPNVGFSITRVPFGNRASTRASVCPSRCGPSSTATTGTPTRAAIPHSHAIDSTVASPRGVSATNPGWASTTTSTESARSTSGTTTNLEGSDPFLQWNEVRGLTPSGGEGGRPAPTAYVPRKPRELVAGGVYHVYARGNDKRRIFAGDRDRREYL